MNIMTIKQEDSLPTIVLDKVIALELLDSRIIITFLGSEQKTLNFTSEAKSRRVYNKIKRELKY